MSETAMDSELNRSAAEAKWDYLFYWQLWHRNWDHADVELIKQLCQLTGKTVLEVGCGDGRMTFLLAPHCRKIIGVDREARFIKVACEQLQKSGSDNVEFLEMDAQALAVDDQSIDVVLFPWVLQMVPDPAKAMKEAYRVLKPGGKMIVIGLRSKADYDRVIGRFVKGVAEIDPIKCYEQPIRDAFGKIDQAIEPENGRLFPYFFESPALAYDAFLFALEYWYGTMISENEKKELQEMLEEFRDGERIRLTFPASIYTATR